LTTSSFFVWLSNLSPSMRKCIFSFSSVTLLKNVWVASLWMKSTGNLTKAHLCQLLQRLQWKLTNQLDPGFDLCLVGCWQLMVSVMVSHSPNSVLIFQSSWDTVYDISGLSLQYGEQIHSLLTECPHVSSCSLALMWNTAQETDPVDFAGFA
jgi:hypothetical protein